jgi:maltooligosyltrehalose trehalohydrolase
LLPLSLGARAERDASTFLVWAPGAHKVELHVVEPFDRVFTMEAEERGYWLISTSDVPAGALYFFRLDGVDRPDPVSRSQPRGVHGPSELTEPWEPPAGFRNPPLNEYLLYELHVGTFTPDGTFDAIIPHLDRLQQLGITAIQLMPVAQFPGARNWGYDGVYPFAAQAEYGGRTGLRRLIDECHRRGLALLLDVVYNHLGPEGNYLRDFGPYFTGRHLTPWGEALNFDGPGSDEVRRYFIENALYWIGEIGVDGLRLDAVHAIHDRSAYPFLRELADRIDTYEAESGRNAYLIAESDLNDTVVVRSRDEGGHALDAQWADDLHHSIHTALTGESSGYYQDYGSLRQLATAYREGWVYSGQYSKNRQRHFGNSPAALRADQIVVCCQNHDQVGNRMQGDRLWQLAGWERAKLAASAVLLSPYVPLLFMGEEYAETAPFLYFVSHSDAALQEAVQAGRKREFAAFAAQGEPPDPQAETTFWASKLNQELVEDEWHCRMYEFYRELIGVRRNSPALMRADKEHLSVECFENENVILLRRGRPEHSTLVFLHFGAEPEDLAVDLPAGYWQKLLDSADTRWGGPGASAPAAVVSAEFDGSLSLMPWSCLVFALA